MTKITDTHKMLVDVSLCTKNGKIVQRSTCGDSSGLLPRTKYVYNPLIFSYFRAMCEDKYALDQSP